MTSLKSIQERYLQRMNTRRKTALKTPFCIEENHNVRKNKYNIRNGNRPAKKIIQKTLKGKVINEYNSISCAARFIRERKGYWRTAASCICSCINGKQKTAYGYKWEAKYKN